MKSEGKRLSQSTLMQDAMLRRVVGLWKDRAWLRTQADVDRFLKRLRGSMRQRLRETRVWRKHRRSL